MKFTYKIAVNTVLTLLASQGSAMEHLDSMTLPENSVVSTIKSSQDLIDNNNSLGYTNQQLYNTLNKEIVKHLQVYIDQLTDNNSSPDFSIYSVSSQDIAQTILSAPSRQYTTNTGLRQGNIRNNFTDQKISSLYERKSVSFLQNITCLTNYLTERN